MELLYFSNFLTAIIDLFFFLRIINEISFFFREY
jgi:hypothetical protein